MQKKYILFLALPVLALVGAWGVSSVYADTFNPQADLVSSIAQKFNLNTADVQEVFNEHRSQMQARGQERFTERLQAGVLTGALTQAQADAISAKHAEMKAQMTAQVNGGTKLTAEQMKAQIDSLKQWAEENNIPQQYLMFGGNGFGRKMGAGFGSGEGGCPMAQ